jgi:xylulokinase
MSLLGIDIGTTGCKAMAFTIDGNAIVSSYKEYSLIISGDGYVEYDPNEVLESVKDVIRNVNSSPDITRDPIEAFSISVPGDEVLPIDKNGKALYNMICSLDNRGLKENAFINKKIGIRKLYNITGLPPSNMYALNRILWFKNYSPKIYSKVYKFASWDSYIYKNFGLDCVSDYSVCSRTYAFDIVNKKWSGEILNKLDISEEFFPECMPSGKVIGVLPDAIANDLGFVKKIFGVSGGFDQICAALGSGVIKEGMAAVGIGTVECMQVIVDNPITSETMLKSNYPFSNHILNDYYICLAINFGGGSLLKWFRDNMAYEEKRQAEGRNMDVYKLFDEKASRSKNPLLVYPYFEGAQTPINDPFAKGIMMGFTIGTKKEDIIRGILEGISFELKLNIDTLEKNGIKIDSLNASGGGSKSDFWLQLKADITGKPIRSLKVNEAGCLAASIIAGYGIGKYNSISEAACRIVKIKKEYYPDRKNYGYYSGRFELYKKMYPLISKHIGKL